MVFVLQKCGLTGFSLRTLHMQKMHRFPKKKRRNRSQIVSLNKNTLGSVESGLLGDKFYCYLVVLLCYFFVWNTKRVLYVMM